MAARAANVWLSWHYLFGAKPPPWSVWLTHRDAKYIIPDAPSWLVKIGVSLPFLCVLGSGMSDGSDNDTLEKVATTLTLPQPGEAERGFQARSEAADGHTQHIEAHPPTKEDQAQEDEDWLEDPAHPRNWPSRTKWTNMAIVSRSPPGPSPIHRSSLLP